jgi:hypothetical protein
MLSWTRAPGYVTKSNVPTVAELKQRLSTSTLKKMQQTLQYLEERCTHRPMIRLIDEDIESRAMGFQSTNKSNYYASRASRIVSNRVSALQSEISKRTRKANQEKNKQLRMKATKLRAKERAKQREKAKKLRAKERASAKKSQGKKNKK